MTLRVQDFRAEMAYDGARPNLFRVNLTFPLQAGGAQRQFSIFCRSSQIPGDTIQPVTQYYLGRELKFAGNRTFSDWTVTVINDEDFRVRRAFELWMSGINSHVGNLRAPEFIKGDGGYQQDGIVTHLGKTGDALKNYKMIGAFPVDLGPIELDYGTNNTIEEYAVTFAIQWWESDTTDSVGSVGPLSPILPPIL